jgi:hypothetical protein
MMDQRIVITVGGDEDQVSLVVDVDEGIDFLTALGALEAAKIQYVQSKFRGSSNSALSEANQWRD